MFFLLPFFPDFTEFVISRGLFKIITVPLGFITSLLPFSLTELTVILAVPLVLLTIVIFVMRLKKSENKKQTAMKGARFVCGFLSFAVFLYMTCHGANYYRYSAAQLLDLDTSQKSPQQLVELCLYLGEKAAAERENIATDESRVMVLETDTFTELSRAGNGYDKLCADYPWLWTSIWRQKPVQLSYMWSYTGIVGMYFPFYAECNINIEQPDFAVPFTAAHESAHSRGIAFEDECNFYAFLSCINSDYAEYRYSGYMQAFKFCSNSLFAYDVELWAETQAVVTDGMRADFAALNQYIDDFSGEVMEVSDSINDSFIKIQGDEDGSFSYSKVTELLLAYYYTER